MTTKQPENLIQSEVIDENVTTENNTETIQIPSKSNPKANKGYVVTVIILSILAGFTAYSSVKNTKYDSPLNSLISNTQTAIAGPVNSEKQKKQILDILQSKYIGNLPSPDKMTQGELQGLVQSVGDKYTTYLSCSDYQKFQDDLNQNFEGIGARFQQNEDYIALDSVLENSPASKSGIKKGDILVSVNGQIVDDLTFDKVIEAIRGDAGTSVKLLMDRPNSSMINKDTQYTQFVFDIKREKIHQDAVVLQDKGDIAWIKVSTFSGEVDSQMNRIVSTIKSNLKYKYIVLDLQDNGGGLLNQAIELSSYFLEPNSVVVKEKGRSGQSEQRSESKLNNLVGYPVLVAVNQGTASASEITAGALQDAGKAKIIGKKTYGKGVVQEIDNLSGCDKLKVTVAEWLTPKGTAINEKGIAPDIRLKRGEDLETEVKSFFTKI